MCQRVAEVALILAFCMASSAIRAITSPVYTVADAASQVDSLLNDMSKVPPSDTAARNSVQSSLASLLDLMRQKSVMLFGERKSRWEAIEAQLEQATRDWTQAASEAKAREALTRARKAWAALKEQYPAEALQILARFWSCPMHSEILVTAAGACSICGMSLEPVYVTQPQLTADPRIRAEIIAGEPLLVGHKADMRIRLTFVDDKSPVSLADLEETHTRKIHLLITERTETDYHHEHPQELGNGEYGFSFTPRLPGPYRVWADLKPLKTHVQQFSIADIPTATPAGRLQANEPENRHAEVNGYQFELSFAKGILLEKDTVAGTLRVTDPNGHPCRQLEVVMGAFGHFVAFRDDFSTVLHMHPVGAVPASDDAVGGPELPFYFRSNAPGLVRLFAQVKIGGVDYFPRFVVRVQPLQHLAGM